MPPIRSRAPVVRRGSGSPTAGGDSTSDALSPGQNADSPGESQGLVITRHGAAFGVFGTVPAVRTGENYLPPLLGFLGQPGDRDEKAGEFRAVEPLCTHLP